MTERNRRALVVRGGWPGHAPEEAAELFIRSSRRPATT